MPEPPYGEIWDLLKEGRVVPLLGAGASMIGRAEGARWNPDEPRFLPSGVELARFLADRSRFPSSDARDVDDLAKVASYFADVSGRRRLCERLRGIMNRPYESGRLHRLLASVPVPIVVVVTNYDTLLEQAFRAAGKPYDLLVYPADRKDAANAVLWWRHGAVEPEIVAGNELDVDLETTTVVHKMHGTVVAESEEWDGYVITEEDYVEFLSRMTTQSAIPAQLYAHFRERSFLFLGYSLRDWNLRVVLKNLSRHLATFAPGSEPAPSWAIQLKPSEIERILWEKREVSIFDVPLDAFAAELERERDRARG